MADVKATVQAIKQLEHDFARAVKAGQHEKAESVLADDWVGIAVDGKRHTKSSLLSDLKSGSLRLEEPCLLAITADLADMEVTVMGNVAVVQGSAPNENSYTDSRLAARKPSGKLIWMDVFENRPGHSWVAVRSLCAEPLSHSKGRE